MKYITKILTNFDRSNTCHCYSNNVLCLCLCLFQVVPRPEGSNEGNNPCQILALAGGFIPSFLRSSSVLFWHLYGSDLLCCVFLLSIVRVSKAFPAPPAESHPFWGHASLHPHPFVVYFLSLHLQLLSAFFPPSVCHFGVFL